MSLLRKHVDEYVSIILSVALKDKSRKNRKPVDYKNHRQDGQKRNKSTNNRNKKKRYSYALCQEIFLECSRKLADAVVNKFRLFWNHPESHQTRTILSVYTKLCGVELEPRI